MELFRERSMNQECPTVRDNHRGMAHTPGGEEYKAHRARFLESFKLNSGA
jgi:hypothetical protein